MVEKALGIPLGPENPGMIYRDAIDYAAAASRANAAVTICRPGWHFCKPWVIEVSGRFFEKKLGKKLLLPAAFERPYRGRSKAAGNKSFLVTFFQKSNGFLLLSIVERMLAA
jgi:hypothetical protein